MIVLAALAALLALALGRAETASAAACPAGLTVAGLALTGADCIEVGNGELEIDKPRLLSGQAVEISGKMILDLARTQLRQKTAGVPLVARVANSAGVYQPFLAGTLTVGTVNICDLGQSFGNTGTIASGITLDGTTPLTNDRAAIQGTSINCRNAAGIDVKQPALQFAAKLLNFTADISDNVFNTENGTAVLLPKTFGLDEARGGRVFGNLSIRLPIRDNITAFAVGAEFSKDEGFKPVAISVFYQANIPLLPGVILKDPGIVIDPVNQRFGGRLRISFPPALAATGAEILFEQGQLKKVAVDVGLPPPGFPLFTPPVLAIQSIGFTFTKGSTVTLPTGQTFSSPASLQGRTSFTAGPVIPLPGGSFKAIVGDVDLTIAGPVVTLKGTLTGLNNLITLGQARVLIAGNPFRFEAEAVVKFPSPAAAVVDGRVFLGATATAFTGLGTVVMQIPSQIPVIGGQKLGGVSAVVSNKAVGGVIFVDPPLLQPRRIGAAFVYGGGFSIIDSITPFITVTPTQSLGRSLAGVRTTFGAGGAGFDVAAGTGDVVAQVKGAGSKPTGVSITGPDGKKVTTFPFPSEDPTILQLGIAKPKAGRYTVTGGGIAEVTVATLDEPSYLDPRAGWGTRAQPPITAGTPVPVCWDLKNAPAGAVVDLFEDTNGFAATGRDIATDLPASGCFDIPTTDWEPGKHWAYGIVRVGDAPISMRYWPIGITITDPNRLAAPAGVKAKATKDGATLSWKAVANSTGYYVTAIPVNPQDAPAVKQVSDVGATSIELSLRGADRWNVSVQAVDSAGKLGNASRTVITGALAPVVLAGTPNGTPQVGQPWAFDLDVRNVKTIKLLASPKGTKLNRTTGLLTWTPSAKAGTVPPQALRVQGCSADKRCVTQEWFLSAYGAGFSPAGPARGFVVLDSVVKPGETIELRAQGIDEKVTAKVDGKVVKATILDQSTVAIVLPRSLKKGAHDVSFRIGQDLEETRKGAIVVL